MTQEQGEVGLSDTEYVVSDAVGQLIEFWGFKKNMGRIWTVLYLSPDPLNAKQLRERLQLSTGAVSMTLNDLLRWGVVNKVWVQGERSDFFSAEQDIWKMISRVLKDRERIEVDKLIRTLEAGLSRLDLREAEDEETRRKLKHQRDRITRLRDFARLGQKMLDILIDQALVDLSPLRRFFASGG